MPSKIPQNLKYAQNHEWIALSDSLATIGISDFAQQELNDVVYVELPEVGRSFSQGEPFAIIESVKAASDVFMPVSGEIVEVNATLETSPELVNDQPYGEGWLVRIRVADPAEMEELMDPIAYYAFVAAQAG